MQIWVFFFFKAWKHLLSVTRVRVRMLEGVNLLPMINVNVSIRYIHLVARIQYTKRRRIHSIERYCNNMRTPKAIRIIMERWSQIAHRTICHILTLGSSHSEYALSFELNWFRESWREGAAFCSKKDISSASLHASLVSVCNKLRMDNILTAASVPVLSVVPACNVVDDFLQSIQHRYKEKPTKTKYLTTRAHQSALNKILR